MAFTFDQVFAADPSNPSNVAQNAAITIFAPGDGTMAPLTITDPDGQPLTNPLTVNANGFASAFAHATLDRVAWAGGGFTGFFTSYEGMKAEATAAKVAAEAAAATAAAEAAADLQARIDNGELKGDKGADGTNVLPTDTAIKDAIDNPVSATRVTLDASFADKAKATEARRRTNTDPSTVVTLMSCQVDETYIKTNCTTAADLVNFKIGNQGVKVTTTAAVTATVIQDPVGPTDPLLMPAASTIGLWVYVPDVTKITSIGAEIYTDSTLTTAKRWSRTATQAQLVTGWNLLRWSASAGLTDLSAWGTVYRTRILVTTNAATDVTVGHFWTDCPPKAQILFIEDRGYKTFKDVGLPDLRALKIPVTWALDPATHGTSAGTKSEVITDADVATFAAAGDSISFHSYAGEVTSTMTADQIRTDTLKAIRWLQQRGHAGRMWRAAWTQNSAPEHAAAQPYVLAYATHNSQAGLSTWPPTDRWNISRWSVHGRTTTDTDTMFNNLKRTHQLLVCYTHGVHADGLTDATPAEWNYFISKCEQGLNEGWLEAVTFEDLHARAGGTFRAGFGRAQAEYLDASGAVVRKDLL